MRSGFALEGMRVLELSQVMAGPYCCLLLADMGADVVKIEKPAGGDDSRRMGPPFIGGESAAFLAMNRNKRSVVVDLKTERGVALVREMAQHCEHIQIRYCESLDSTNARLRSYVRRESSSNRRHARS
ncbi:MAG TPA: hypothetical protein DEP84_06090 [Chloroflexi bacterium]|nr:hypothetical protein [Chloroflexota bacterium]